MTLTTKMKGRLWHTLILTLQLITFSSFTDADNRKFVGGEYCLISQFCEEQNAINALQTEFGMTTENATSYISNRTIERSCSCQDSCIYLGICCQDKHVAVPPQLLSLSNSLKQDPTSYTCQKKLGKDVVVISKCPSSAPLIMRKRCSEVSQLELLVTSNQTKLTYQNMYCGLCNGENFEMLKGWAWNFDCVKNIPQFLIIPQNATGSSIVDKAEEKLCYLNKTITMIPPAGIEVHNNIGVYLDSMSICTHPPISTCPSPSKEGEDCRTGPTSIVLYDGKVYRNKHCLSCNEEMAQENLAICEACENEKCRHPAVMIHKLPLLGSFGILVQPYNDVKVVKCKTVNEEDCGGILDSLATCGHGEYLQYQTSTCVSICPETYVLKDGSCEFLGVNSACKKYVTVDQYEELTFDANQTNQLHSKTFMALGKSSTICYNCSRTNPITAATENFEINDNEEIRFRKNLISANLVYKVDGVNYYVCLDNVVTIEETTPDYMWEIVITHLLLSLSILSLLLYFAAYVTIERLRNVPGKIVAGNMMCLFFAYLFFVIRSVPGLEETTGCTAIGILINYFFLASFIFNIIYASFIVHSLEFIDFESNVNKWTAMRMWLIGLLAPFLVIVPGIIIDNVPGAERYRPQYGGDQCFIGSQRGRVLFFIAPIGICLFLAISLYLAIIIKLIHLAKQTSQVRSNHSEKIAVAIKLLIVLGFNWVFAVIAGIEQGNATTLIFIVTCTLQGFFGFVVFICNKATIHDIKRCLKKRKTITLEMESSGRTGSKITTTTEVKKDLLKQMDSSKALLRGPDEASV